MLPQSWSRTWFCGMRPGHETSDDRVFALPGLVQIINHLPDCLIQRGNKRRIPHALFVESLVLVIVQPLLRTLQWIVRQIDRPIDKPRLLVRAVPAVFIHVFFQLIHGQLREKPPVAPDFRIVLPEIMAVGTTPIKIMRVVVDATAAMSEKVIKALRIWQRFRSRTHVPFAKERRVVAIGFHHLCDGRALAWKRRVRPRVTRESRPAREHARHERRARRRAQRRAIKLRETHTLRGEPVEMRRMEILRSVIIQIKRPLVVRIYQKDIGSRLRGARALPHGEQ